METDKKLEALRCMKSYQEAEFIIKCEFCTLFFSYKTQMYIPVNKPYIYINYFCVTNGYLIFFLCIFKSN